jgi:hypothetical protein
MRRLAVLLLLLPFHLPAADGKAADLANQLRSAGLDGEECYRVRDLSFSKQDIRLYLTDGYLIFGKAVDGRRHSAVFVADDDGGDAEILLFPPNRSERLSLARATDSPNLSEHFKTAVMIFTDDTYATLLKQILEPGDPRKSPERAVLLEQAWNSVVRNLTSSFEVRLVADIASSRTSADGFFYSAIGGGKLGNFDVMHDPLNAQQILIGRVALRGGLAYFDTWTSFAARTAGQSRPAPLGEAYRLSNYRLDATLEPDLKLKVTTRVTMVPLRSQIPVLAFGLSPRMSLTSASIDGAPTEFFQRDTVRETLLRGGYAIFLLLPASTLEVGKPYELEFENEGSVIHSAGNDVYYVSSRENWYPSSPDKFAQFEVTFRYPKALNLVVAGEALETGTDGEWNTAWYRTDTPVRLLGFNLGVYEHLSLAQGPYKIEVYANKQAEPGLQAKPRQTVVMTPSTSTWDPLQRKIGDMTVAITPAPSPNPPDRLRQLASEIGGAFEFMTARFGPPPVRTLTVSPIPGSTGQGFPGLVYLPTALYVSPDQRPGTARDRARLDLELEVMAAHEVAHQWWGNVVAPAGDEDTWVAEALANYSALLYLEKQRGPRVLASILAGYKAHLLESAAEGRSIESTGPIVWGLRLESSQAPDAWRAITYEKGSWIVHMLRRRLGDDRFLAMLAELAKRYRYSTVTTEQFRALAAEFVPSGMPDPTLEAFFESSVYGTGVPTLQMKYSAKGKAPSVRLSGAVSQSNVEAGFSSLAPVEIQPAAGKPIIRWVQVEGEPASFDITLKAAPLKVQLDPSDSVLAVRK